MEENYNENNVEVLDNEETEVEEVSSGNSFNMGAAAIGAAVLGGLIAGGVTLAKKIKKKRAAAETDASAEKPEPKKAKKGLKIGKRRLVVIDERTPDEESEEE